MDIKVADQLAGQSPAEKLDAMGKLTRQRRLLELQELEMLAEWAAINSTDDENDEAFVKHGLKKHIGGEGTPFVMEHCLGEPAIVRRVGIMSIINATADVLDLQHRLPKIWAATQQGVVDVWLPRKVAKLSRHLSVEYIGLVDEAIAPLLGHEGAARILEITAAKIIEADPATHQERVEAEKKRRYVGLGRTDEFGLRMFIARISSGDAVWLDATISQVVEIIRPDHPKTSADELRAIAFGYLARPAELFAMLTENLDTGDTADTNETADPEEAAEPLNRAIALPADVLAKLNDLNLKALAPKIVLNVHLSEAALQGVATAVRVEGLGPVSLTQLKAMLTGCNITVKPVIDLNDRVRATAYEHPEGLKERVYLITGGDYFPYANSTSRNTDYDHVTPYVHETASERDGPPGQTGTHNSGPLTRRPHRMKTHSGYRSRQAGDGRYVWITPHGLCVLVDQHGSRPIPAEEGPSSTTPPQAWTSTRAARWWNSAPNTRSGAGPADPAGDAPACASRAGLATASPIPSGGEQSAPIQPPSTQHVPT